MSPEVCANAKFLCKTLLTVVIRGHLQVTLPSVPEPNVVPGPNVGNGNKIKQGSGIQGKVTSDLRQTITSTDSENAFYYQINIC